MNINKHDADVEMEMNMTPMIDVVFLLIIFFMIITDLTQQDLEELKLPVAVSAVEDKPDPKIVRPVMNILHTGEVIVKRETKYDPESEDLSKVEAFLADQARQMLAGGYKKGWDYLNSEGKSGPKIPDNPLLIRADQNTPFKYIQRIMEVCGKKGIQIWKLELAAAEDEKAKEARKTGGE